MKLIKGNDVIAGVSTGIVGEWGGVPCAAAAGAGPELAPGGTPAWKLGELQRQHAQAGGADSGVSHPGFHQNDTVMPARGKGWRWYCPQNHWIYEHWSWHHADVTR